MMATELGVAVVAAVAGCANVGCVYAGCANAGCANVAAEEGRSRCSMGKERSVGSTEPCDMWSGSSRQVHNGWRRIPRDD